LERRAAIEKRLRENQTRGQLLRKTIGKLKQRRQALLVELGVQDEAQLRRRLASQAETAKLEQERADLHAEIQQMLAASEHSDAVTELLSGNANLTAVEAQSQAAADNISKTLAQLFERRGQITQ